MARTTGSREGLRRIPSVDALLRTDAGRKGGERFGRPLVKLAINRVLDDVRASVDRGYEPPEDDVILARAVPVSRGELIEIGGEFRLPDIMAASGAKLVEVGTTNRTRIGDVETAINEKTGLLLKVHPSNYRVVGFVETPSASELSELARQ